MIIIYLCVGFTIGLGAASILCTEAKANVKGLIPTTVIGLLIVVAIGFGVRHLTPGMARVVPPTVVMEDSKVPEIREQPREASYKVTAYCPCSKCCGQFADGITASGHVIQPGDAFVAAPKSLPFGTMVTVPGYNDGQPVPVLDRGGAIKEGRLDLFFATHQEALNWGVKICNVLVKDKD